MFYLLVVMAVGGCVAVSVMSIVLMFKAIGLIDSLRNESEFRYAKAIVDRAVVASEQLAASELMPQKGSEKKNVVFQFLKDEGVNLPDTVIDFLIEAAVLDNNDWFELSLKKDKQPENTGE